MEWMRVLPADTIDVDLRAGRRDAIARLNARTATHRVDDSVPYKWVGRISAASDRLSQGCPRSIIERRLA
eukprot:3447287-Prymnesium_polylepis.1